MGCGSSKMKAAMEKAGDDIVTAVAEAGAEVTKEVVVAAKDIAVEAIKEGKEIVTEAIKEGDKIFKEKMEEIRNDIRENLEVQNEQRAESPQEEDIYMQSYVNKDGKMPVTEPENILEPTAPAPAPIPMKRQMLDVDRPDF